MKKREMLRYHAIKLKQFVDGTHYFRLAFHMFKQSPIKVASIYTMVLFILDFFVNGKKIFLVTLLIVLHGLRNTCSPEKNIIHLMWFWVKKLGKMIVNFHMRHFGPSQEYRANQKIEIKRRKQRSNRRWLDKIKCHAPWQR